VRKWPRRSAPVIAKLRGRNFDSTGDPNPARYYVYQVTAITANWSNNVLVGSCEFPPPLDQTRFPKENGFASDFERGDHLAHLAGGDFERLRLIGR
jgi:hypothetical protein